MLKISLGIIALIAITLGAWWLLAPKTPEIMMEEIKTIVSLEPEIDHSPITLATSSVTFGDGTNVDFTLAEDFEVKVAAEELGKARFMAMSPDGRLFVPDIVDYSLSHEGKLYVLEDWNEETGRFDTKHTYLSSLRGPNSVAFYTDENGQDWLYLALTAHLVRYPYQAGDTAPSGEGEIVAEFPNEQSPGEVSVVWHITRTIFFHNDRVYISVGSGCNACEELAGDMRAMIYSMKPDGSDQRVEGEGLRNTVGIEMANGKLYATANGVDHLGVDAPDEALYLVENAQHYGWPYCYLEDGEHVPDTTYTWSEDFDCTAVPAPIATFTPRSAPLGLRYFETGAHPRLAETFLVAIHGSFVPGSGASPKIRRVTEDGKNEIFMDGFSQGGERVARPVDFLQIDENSFFFTDDHGGRIFLVRAKSRDR